MGDIRMPRHRRARIVSILIAVMAIAGSSVGCWSGGGQPGAHAAPATTASATGDFAHPGVLVSRDQLDFVKKQVAARAQPWKQAYDAMLATPSAAAGYRTKPRAVVDCGPYDHPDNGCGDERRDAAAAYTDALAGYISGQARFAQKSIEIMDAWSQALTGHTGSNAPLQSGWAASVWTRAAEIVRYTYTGWPGAEKFAELLRKVYLPKVITGSPSNGNWELSMLEASQGIGIFLDDRATYDKAVAMYLNRVPAYVYLSSDGPLPKVSARTHAHTPAEITKYWWGQSQLVDGVAQETCRDFAHTGYGLSAIAHIAETGRIQHHDLYPQVADRLRAGFELHSKYQLGEPMPAWLCGGHLERELGPVTEVAYNALHSRMGMDMPYTGQLTDKQRPAGMDLFTMWETLTHASNPA
ncbi:hypothetical protein ABIA39_002513 [Nocardia sp. GAS34]|uniref:alginate lyase family protein n=1 Tax=unclassified Nocardia TaxID=2637762 RepID=UPI003D23F5A7